MTDLNKPFESRRSDVTRVNSLGVKLHLFTVDTLIEGVGEALFAVPFPIAFVERPSFTCGLSLDDNIAPVALNYPTYSVTVVSWTRVQKQGENVGYFYRGALVSVVLTGDAGQRAWVSTTFTGKALRNPTTGSTGLGL